MARKHKLSLRQRKQEKFLKALKRNGGFVMPAARAAKIHRNTHTYWLRTDEAYRENFLEIIADSVERHLDDIEAVLLKNAKSGEPWAVMLFLRAIGKSRGYSLRHDPKTLQQQGPVITQIFVTNEADKQRMEKLIDSARNNDKYLPGNENNGS
jgi:hypothetical protein